MRHPHTLPPRLIFTAATVAALATLCVTAHAETPMPVSNEACTLETGDSIVETVDGCTVETHTGVVHHAQLGESFEVMAQDLTCGAISIETWPEVRRDALEACRWVDPQPDRLTHYDMAEHVEVLGGWNGLVSIEQDHSGYAGGAHPWGAVEVSTWDTVTGRKVTLREVLPGHAEAIENTLRRRYDAHADADLYRFDPDAFVILDTDDGVPVLRFKLPHGVEVVRGTTLDFDIRLPEGVEPQRPDEMMPVSY